MHSSTSYGYYGACRFIRGKKLRTTVSWQAVAACDCVNRQFGAERPYQLWMADYFKKRLYSWSIYPYTKDVYSTVQLPCRTINYILKCDWAPL